MLVRPRHLGAVPVAAALAAGLVACGGGTSGASSAAQPASSAGVSSSSAAPAVSGTAGRRGQAAQFQQRFAEIRQCLQAAGIAVPTLPARPSFSRGARPSFSPGARRTFSPGARPSGAARRGGFGGLFANPQAQAALKACGISMPSFSPRAANPTP